MAVSTYGKRVVANGSPKRLFPLKGTNKVGLPLTKKMEITAEASSQRSSPTKSFSLERSPEKQNVVSTSLKTFSPKKAATSSGPASPSRPKKIIQLAKAVLINNSAKSVIIEQAHYKGPDSRRTRTPWTDEECEALEDGVAMYGAGEWAKILADPDLYFNNRTSVDLKDKWRNITQYLAYGSRPIRSYMLVDHNHVPVCNESGNQRVFRNRYPRDAALKIATKDEFYSDGKEFIEIFLRELQGEDNKPPIVHVYSGTRQKYIAASIPKFKGQKTMWVASVEKLREEQLFDRKVLLEDA